MTTTDPVAVSPVSIANVGDVYETSDDDDEVNNNYDDDNGDEDQVLLTDGDGIFNTTTSNDSNNTTDQCIRVGTVSSARFNILSTMVGGGCLSLPLAFQKSGNGFIGPLLLLVTAAVTEFVFRIHIQSARLLHTTTGNNNQNRQQGRGNDSFENVAATAFGTTMRTFCTALVLFMCFFGTVGYAVLLRDMLRPINNTFFVRQNHSDADLANDNTLTWRDNISMWIVIFGITPACTIRSLTSLQKFGALGMCSVLILGCCIFFRSGQCLIYSSKSLLSNFQLFPNEWHDLLDVLPLYISCYVCHYNILPVHNELRNPTKPRVRYWLQSTVWLSTIFYCCMGIAGSVYGSCSNNGDRTIPVHGNILLDFPEKDPLLLIGRMCLAITITLAFPMLTIPARDIVLRTIVPKVHEIFVIRKQRRHAAATHANATLTEALLEDYNDNNNNTTTTTADRSSNATDVAIDSIEQQVTDLPGQNTSETTVTSTSSFCKRLSAAVFMLYTATILASCVTSIDIVWDLLGSSLSILLSYMIPCGSYILICQQQQQQRRTSSIRQRISIVLAGLLVVIYTPLMFISTFNAIYNIFILHKK